MSPSLSDLDRIADDIFKDRLITGSVYCGRCGYNLRTRPYIDRCPECGGEYNARPLVMRGIFTAYDVAFPFEEIFVALICIACAAVLAYVGYTSPGRGAISESTATCGMAAVSGIMGAAYLWRAHRGFWRFVRALGIARRIAAAEAEEG
jgi:hypothetical protein